MTNRDIQQHHIPTTLFSALVTARLFLTLFIVQKVCWDHHPVGLCSTVVVFLTRAAPTKNNEKEKTRK